jgi:hypothetical protein
VADSPAYLALDPFERAVLAEILRRFNGYNNGSIGVTYEEIGERLKGRNRCRPNNRRIARAVARLVDHGLIGEPEPHSWMERRSREYRLTFVTSGKAPPFRSATNDYLRWLPGKAKIVGYSPSPRVAQSGDAGSPKPLFAGDRASPIDLKNGSFSCSPNRFSGDAESLLIFKPYGGTENNGSVWWTANAALIARVRLQMALFAWIAPQELRAAA